MNDIHAKQLAALVERRRRSGLETKDLEALMETKDSGSFTTETWPDDLYVVPPLVSGRGVPDFTAPSTISNSAIYACVNTVATAFMEAPLDIFRENTAEGGRGEYQLVDNHPIRRLLRRPNTVDDSDAIAISIRAMGWINQWNKHIDGNAYWYMVRSGNRLSGNVVELWPLSPSMVEPIAPGQKEDASKVRWTPMRKEQQWIAYYEYRPLPSMTEPIRLPPQNVIHFKLGIDPHNYRKGLGPVKMLAREVASDELATQFTNALLKNSAIPGLIVVPEDGWVDPDVAQEVKDRMRQEFGSGQQGGIAVLSAGAKVEQFGFDPQSMSLLSIHKHCEERIAAVMNVPAIVAQLGAGLEQSAQFTNFHEAREMFAEDTMLPLWMSDSEVLTAQLLPNFTTRTSFVLRYDVEKVRALQQDQSNLYGRLQIGVKGGWLTANEARARVGLEPIDQKEQQVPLTQGEDNRFNIMVEKGLVTLNEVRESIGLPPMAGGDALLKDFLTPPQLLAAQEFGPEGSPFPPQQNAAPGLPAQPMDNTRGAPVPVPSDVRPGAALPQDNSVEDEDNNIVRRQKALSVLLDTMTPDELLEAKRVASSNGMSLTDFAELALGSA